ncbi:hypothetical protein [Thermogladius sp.]|uniref:hypothetical protein n=1 Tax=Thermogladius sp. TaxID=2023064 RepID=UPI003D0B9A88
MAKLFLLEFTSPYHVGWRESLKIIESVTLHRALLYAAYELLGDGGLADRLTKTRMSSVLPAIKTNGCYEVLVPVDHLPSTVRLSKLGVEWAPISAVGKLVAEVNKRCGGRAFVLVPGDGALKVKCGGDFVLDLSVGEGLLTVGGGDHLRAGAFFELLEVWRNRVDRVTGAADLFKATLVKPKTTLGVIVDSDQQQFEEVEKTLRLLGEVGIGGMRTTGAGKFIVREGRLCAGEDMLTGVSGPGFHVTLGAYLPSVTGDPVDRTRSAVRLVQLEGYAGTPLHTYILPKVVYAGAGSVLYFDKTPALPHVIKIGTGGQPAPAPVLVFNPVIVGG